MHQHILTDATQNRRCVYRPRGPLEVVFYQDEAQCFFSPPSLKDTKLGSYFEKVLQPCG